MRTIDHNTGEVIEETRTIAPIDALRQQLAIASTIPEKRVVREKAGIYERMAMRAKNLELQNHYAMIGIDADREIGRELDNIINHEGGRPRENNDTVSLFSAAPTLSDLGITNKQSSRWQEIASIPDDTCRAYYAVVEAEGDECSRAGLLRFARGAEPTEADESQGAALDVAAADEDKPGENTKLDGDEWYTPEIFIEAARILMGSIDVDPATNAAAQSIIKAAIPYTKEDNSLNKPWFGKNGEQANVWCNPPYSTKLVQRFTAKLIDEWECGNIKSAVYLVNNCTDAGWFHSLIERFPVCFTRGRVKFWRPDKTTFATRQGQAFFYLGGDVDRFVDIFSQFGVVVTRAGVEVTA